MKCSNLNCDHGIGLVSYRRGWFDKRRFCSKRCRDYFTVKRPSQQKQLAGSYFNWLHANATSQAASSDYSRKLARVRRPFRGTAINSGGNMTGNWFESTNQVAGQFLGSIEGNHIDARIEGQTFAAFFNMTTHGNHQSVSLRSPGSRVSSVIMALTRR